MIDTHAHIDDEQYAEGFMQFIEQQKEAGVEAIVVPGTNKQSIATVLSTCSLLPGYCYPALGLHPEEVAQDWQEQVAMIRQALLSNKCVAVGEIGLDYHFDTTYKEEQKQALKAQIDIALELQLPVLLHSRDATEDMLTILLPYASRGLRGVMHCFSGSKETAERIVRMGLKLGIGGVLTFKNSHLRETLSHVPIENIVLETDSPYMAPVPHRGKRNEPRYISYVIERLTEVYDLTAEQIELKTSQNARDLLGI